MWRMQSRWDDAYRVAKQHGGMAAAQQVAFAWALSMSPTEGGKLLQKLGLVQEAVDFAMQTGNWEFAYDLAQKFASGRLGEVHEKNAMALEDAGRFEEAEVQFVAAGKPKEAIDMYVHQQDWAAAKRIAHLHAPEAYDEVLQAQITLSVDRRDWPRAEALCIEAKKFDLCVKMYLDQGMINDARRFAAQYAPHLMQSIIGSGSGTKAGLSAGTGSGPLSSILKQGRALEDRREWSKALDVYMMALPDPQQTSSDHDVLEEIWDSACRITMNYLPQRSQEIAAEVGKRFFAIGRFDQSADVYAGVEMYEEAARAQDAAGNISEADRLRGLAKLSSRPAVAPPLQRTDSSGYAPSAPRPQPTLQQAQQSAVSAGSPPSKKGSVSNYSSAQLDQYARRNQWDECIRLAVQEGPQFAAHYALQYADYLCLPQQLRNYSRAVHVLAEHGVPQDIDEQQLTHILFDIVRNSVISSKDSVQAGEARSLLHSLSRSYPDDATVSRWLDICQLNFTALSAEQSGLKDVAARARTSLLRFVYDLPADKLFFDAGMACKKIPELANQAFVLLNRFLDISEAIEEGDDAQPFLDNADFVNSDIPFDFEIPHEHSVSDANREDARSWVLAVSLDTGIEQQLPERDCSNCGRHTFEGALKCSQCQHLSEPCAVTGYPVSSRVSCTACNRPANRESWNQWVGSFKSCPWCTSSQMPFY
jgi:intraflagellar transport protein 172